MNEIVKNEARLNQVAYKNTQDFYESLVEFSKKYFDVAFIAKDLKFGKNIIKAEEIQKLYSDTYKSKTPAVRIEWIVDYIIDKLNINTAIQEISERLKKIIYPFFEENNILKIYADFLTNIGMMFEFNANEEIRYDDLAPLMYLTNYFIGLKQKNEVKYLIIDEMQDYSFVHYSIFNQIFKCNKTILGDINQCIEKIMNEKDLEALTKMLDAQYIQLNRSYRSTYEISEFAKKLKDLNCKSVERHGEQPQIQNLNKQQFTEEIQEICQNNNYNSVAILTKNEEEAKNVYMLMSNIEDVSLLLSSNDQQSKISIMPSYLAKGLEFDVVVVPYYNSKNYKNYIDNNLLYVSCTRALHKLCLFNIKDN